MYFNALDVFLDNSTGDYYTFKKDQELWVPIGNVGLHYSKAAELEGTEEVFAKHSKAHSSRVPSYGMSELITSKISERKLFIKKEYLNHWSLAGVSASFIASNESLWNCHPVKLAASINDVNFEVLVESK